jgi:hypothetical protein
VGCNASKRRKKEETLFIDYPSYVNKRLCQLLEMLYKQYEK